MLFTKGMIDEQGFVHCPVCGGKTRQKARENTYLKNLNADARALLILIAAESGRRK